MNLALVLAFLFFVGSLTGWVLELVFRRFFSATNPERKWINPGFCTGPYIPLYGFGLCVLFLVASLEKQQPIVNPVVDKLLFFGFAAAIITALEYLAGLFCLRVLKVRLWDYTGLRGNVQGIICPLFSLFWAMLSAAYYFLIHPHILDALGWLSNNLAFSFFIGLFFGFFIIDVVHSAQLVAKLKTFAEENDVVLRYESIKAHIRANQEKAAQRIHFFRPFRSDKSLHELLMEMRSDIELHMKK